MTPISLALEGFQELLDRFGGNLESWPEADRTAAQELLATSLDARHLMDNAQALERALQAMPKAPSGLVDRILAAADGATKKP